MVRDAHKAILMPESPPAEPAATAGGQLTESILGFVVSQAISVAAALRIADRLAAGPRSATALAVAARADPDGLYRLLRLLAGHGIFTELPGGRFANSPQSQLLAEGPGSLRPLAVAVGEGGYPALGATRQMVQTGEPAFQLVFGAVWEEHLAGDPAARRRFNRSVAARRHALVQVLADHAWGGTDIVVDVGGGNGALLVGLLERRPRLRAGSSSTSRSWWPRPPNGSRRRAWPVAARRWPGASSKASPRAATPTSWPTCCTPGRTPAPGRSSARCGG
jgi:Dimerisation domain